MFKIVFEDGEVMVESTAEAVSCLVEEWTWEPSSHAYVGLLNPAPYRAEALSTVIDRAIATTASNEWAGARFEGIDGPAEQSRDWREGRRVNNAPFGYVAIDRTGRRWVRAYVRPL